jgi:hypothetical protein
LAAKFRAAVDGLAGSGGVSVTLMTAEGTWEWGGRRDVVVNDQFNIGSVTKSLAAAQVMQLVEAGELSLDDLALIIFLRIPGSTPGREGAVTQSAIATRQSSGYLGRRASLNGAQSEKPALSRKPRETDSSTVSS